MAYRINQSVSTYNNDWTSDYGEAPPKKNAAQSIHTQCNSLRGLKGFRDSTKVDNFLFPPTFICKIILFHWSQETLEVNELYVFVFLLPGGLACKLQRKFNMVFVLKVSIIFSGNKQFKKFTSSMRQTNTVRTSRQRSYNKISLD